MSLIANFQAVEHRRVMAAVFFVILLGAGPAKPDPVQTLAGRYYRQFTDALVTGEKYTGEDIVEIVPVASNAAYIRIHLDYYNGHNCGIYGVAQTHDDELVYRDPDPDYDGGHCVLRVKRTGSSLLIDDGNGTCSSSCGARGTLSDVKLPYGSKRPIRYLSRIKASREYRWALEEWRTGVPITEQAKRE